MSKRMIRRPTEDLALSHVMRDQRLRAKQAVQEVVRRARSGEKVEREILEFARQVLLEE